MIIATNDNAQVTISVADLKNLIKQEVNEEIKKVKPNSNPTGTIISQMGKKAPEGYLVCDGTIYNISEYEILANYVKEQFGSYNYWGGDGETTFAVPDLRGEFLRGTGTAKRNTGTGIEVGKHQDGTVHMEVISNTKSNIELCRSTATGTVEVSTNKDKIFPRIGYTGIYSAGTWNEQVSNSYGSYTSRPTNTAVLYCIKY